MTSSSLYCIAMRTGSGLGTTGLTYLATDHLGSTSVMIDAATYNKTGEVRYSPWGETRYRDPAAPAPLPTDRLYTGQRLESDLGLYYYNARWYDPSIIQFQQPDTLVPDPYNPLDWNRYAYARYNPVKYTDPSGHAVSLADDGGSAISKCELCYDDEYYYGYWHRSTRVEIPEPTLLKSSTWTPPTRGRTQDTACSGSNWSVVCRAPSFVTNGQVATDVAYPIYQTPSNYDGPYAEKACIIPFLCILGLGADAVVWGHYQTGTSSYMQGSYATANLNYETHKNAVGYFTEVTSVDITNQTDATLTLREVVINDIVQFSPVSPININSGVSGTFYFDPYPISGRSGSARITFTSDLYTIIVLTANYP